MLNMKTHYGQIWICLACCTVLAAGELVGEKAVCKSDADCAATECCVGEDKRRFVLNRPTSGTCQPLRYQGHACHVFIRMDPYNPNVHVHYCPCEKGLECRGTTVDGRNTTHEVHHNPKCLPVIS